MKALEAGFGLAAAAAMAMQRRADFDLAANLAGLMTSGAMVALLACHAEGRFPQ
jgi:hypothetical protein